MTLRSPLSRVRGLGSAKNGVQHYIAQRLTALALVPLTLWFVISVVSLIHADYQHFHAWIAQPGCTAMLLLLIFAVFYHAQLGLQVVEDYVHSDCTRSWSLVAVKFASILLGVFAAVSVLRVALVGG